MLAQDREEETEFGGLVDRGAYGEGHLVVWDTTDGVLFFPLLETNFVVHQRGLAGGGTEPLEGAWEMGTDGEDLGNGGSG